MGLLDKVKKATGVGLNHQEQYLQAFEKGVLLGPSRFADAVTLFEKAAKKAEEAGDVMFQTRALANARLYGFISTGDVRHLQGLSGALAHLNEIEQVGSQHQVTPADTLKMEVDARLLEAEIQAMHQGDHANLAHAHQNVSQRFKPLFNTSLITYKYHSSDQHVETGQGRFFYHQALSMLHEAHTISFSNPEAAAENMAKAANAFTQCHETERATASQQWLRSIRKKRTCWICHREVQGENLHFRSFDADVTPYVVELVRKLGHDPAMLDQQNGSAVLCSTCGSILESAADRLAIQRVQELRAEVGQQLAALNQSVQQLANRIKRIPLG